MRHLNKLFDLWFFTTQGAILLFLLPFYKNGNISIEHVIYIAAAWGLLTIVLPIYILRITLDALTKDKGSSR